MLAALTSGKQEPGTKRRAGVFSGNNVYQLPKKWTVAAANILLTVVVVTALMLLLFVFDDLLSVPCRPEDETNAEKCNAKRRRATVASAIFAGLRVVVVIVGVVVLLHHAGLRTTTLFTLGSILSLVIGLAAQNSIKDVFSGITFLAEEQLNQGDFVQLITTCGTGGVSAGASGGTTGTAGSSPLSGIVEHVSMRRIKLRNFDNEVIYVPNSEVRAIINASQKFPVVRLRLHLSRTADSDQALASVRDVCTALSSDASFRAFFPPGTISDTQDHITDASLKLMRSLDAVGMTGPEPEVLGVSDIGTGGFEIMVRFMTDTGKQWNAGRFARQRFVRALEVLGPVVQVVKVENA
jgi:small-conductance mechanosensitive channel